MRLVTGMTVTNGPATGDGRRSVVLRESSGALGSLASGALPSRGGEAPRVRPLRGGRPGHARPWRCARG